MLPPQFLTTFRIVRPPRPATCAEYGCWRYRDGFKVVVDESTDLGRQQAHYIRKECGRRFTEDREERPGLTAFKFEAGQECFAKHAMPWDGQERLLEHGLWGRRDHTRADDWVDSFANNQIRLADIAERG